MTQAKRGGATKTLNTYGDYASLSEVDVGAQSARKAQYAEAMIQLLTKKETLTGLSTHIHNKLRYATSLTEDDNQVRRNVTASFQDLSSFPNEIDWYSGA
jgi:hypothetical protein